MLVATSVGDGTGVFVKPLSAIAKMSKKLMGFMGIHPAKFNLSKIKRTASLKMQRKGVLVVLLRLWNNIVRCFPCQDRAIINLLYI